MLKNLHIENIAVIEKSDIEFNAGFNVLSGETGAGKSIVIDSLIAILGGRTSRDIIRHGESRAGVRALFVDLQSEALEKAAELGYECEDNSILIQREISTDGRNMCRINAMPATVAILRALGEYLINIHGQNDGMRLLDSASHIDYLDSFGANDTLLAEYYNEYKLLLGLRKQTKEATAQNEELQRREIELRARAEELEDAEISVGEFAQISEQRNLLANAEKIALAARVAKEQLFGTDDTDGAIAMITRTNDSLGEISDCSSDASDLFARTRELLALAQDLQMDIDTFALGVEYSPQDLAIAEERLDLLTHLLKKYATNEDGLLEILTQTNGELEKIENIDEEIKSLNLEYSKKREVVSQLAQNLHESRLVAAENLKTSIESEMHQLDMPHAKFQISVDSTADGGHVKFTRRGTDTVAFTMTTNPGEDFKPIEKVASGGELSRIMLAIKSVLSQCDSVGTMVFDEIDAGVSGRAANKVGEKLFLLSRNKQVLCVTHLAQIAALGQHEYLISKEVLDGRTVTNVELLSRDRRADEIARMTAGMNITEQTLSNAREILSIAESFQQKSLDN